MELCNASSSFVSDVPEVVPPAITAVVTMFGEVRHNSQGYVNGTDLGKAAGTTAQAYLSVEKNKLFVSALAEDLGMSVKDLMIPGKGGGNPRPAMWHPEVAMDLARWSNPRLAVQLSRILYRFFSGTLKTEDSIAAHKVIMSRFHSCPARYAIYFAMRETRCCTCLTVSPPPKVISLHPFQALTSVREAELQNKVDELSVLLARKTMLMGFLGGDMEALLQVWMGWSSPHLHYVR